MRYDKRSEDGKLLGHYEVSDDAVAQGKVSTVKVRGEAERKSGAKPAGPKGLKLLTSEKGARDEFGEHDLYVYGDESAMKYVPEETALPIAAETKETK
jgi:hypothetical protein